MFENKYLNENKIIFSLVKINWYTLITKKTLLGSLLSFQLYVFNGFFGEKKIINIKIIEHEMKNKTFT